LLLGCRDTGARYDAGRTVGCRRIMKAIVRTCWEICLLRQGPQVFPRSAILLAIMLVLYMLTDTVIGLSEGIYNWKLLIESLLDIGMLIAYCTAILSARRLMGRINQTLVALLGTGILLMWFNLPFLALVAQIKFPYLQLPAYFGMISLFVWSIAVMAHILRQAMNIPNYLALLLAAPYQIFNLLLLYWLFPAG